MADKVAATFHGLTDAERVWVAEQVAAAPPLTEAQARVLGAIFANPLGRRAAS